MSECDVNELKTQVNEIHDALLGGFEKEGLISRINKLEAALKNAIGAGKVVLGIVVALIIAYLKMALGL